MEGKLQLRKPENWQDFERLCKVLWGEIWDCPNTIKRNGRQGQAQAGIDIYCISEDKKHYRGIQCKGKDEYTKSQLTEKEIDAEIQKAKQFVPALDTFYFATTAVKDAHIEEYVRKKNIKSLESGGFSIDVFAWEDIVDLIESHRQTYNWYVNNCQYKDSTDVKISFMGKMQYSINPQYFKVKKIYTYKPKIDPCKNPWSQDFTAYIIDKSNRDLVNFQKAMCPLIEKDYRWCSIPITIENSGATVIDDYKLSLIFDSDEVEDIDDNFRYLNNKWMDQATVAQINNAKDSHREVFISNEYDNVIVYSPRNSILVQKDHVTFEIKVMPKSHLIQKINIRWEMFSRNYSKSGEIHVNVNPSFESKSENIFVDKIEDVKQPEEEIRPKKLKK